MEGKVNKQNAGFNQIGVIAATVLQLQSLPINLLYRTRLVPIIRQNEPETKAKLY